MGKDMGKGALGGGGLEISGSQRVGVAPVTPGRLALRIGL